MPKQIQHDKKQQQDEQISLKYEGKIQDGNLDIGDWQKGDKLVTNMNFVEKYNIQKLKIYVSDSMNVKFRSITINQLTLDKSEQARQQVMKLNIDDLELENLEVLHVSNNKLVNNQLYNLAKFKKLHTLNVSRNDVDLTHIHVVPSLTKLYMQRCGLKNIEQISSLVNLHQLDLSANKGLDLNPLIKLKSLTELCMKGCGLKNIDQIGSLTNLQVLDISLNTLVNIKSISRLVNLKELNIMQNENIDISPLKELQGLVKLDLRYCKLKQLSALRPLINLQILDISFNSNINITTLQYLKNLTHLYIKCCGLVSVCVLRPLVKLEELLIATNEIVYLDANIINMKQLKTLRVEDGNRICDFSTIEQHPNFNSIDKFGKRCFNISGQIKPFKQQLRQANNIRRIESPNIQLKEIQSQHKSLNTALNSRKQEINAVLNNARQSQIQFTANVVHLFQLLNQFGFE
ncbi:leucine-rich_repeat domain-containing protein [Hexamita inflata]|uniref:Leucine-rich repeat domain-containing protein n=1 Tax=Hexamita inflata TaxID=28002 RepID=A0AA86U3U0_9EUKA|nr:leucine-rich repeat domain-containing protein [Hexamita inflata]